MHTGESIPMKKTVVTMLLIIAGALAGCGGKSSTNKDGEALNGSAFQALSEIGTANLSASDTLVSDISASNTSASDISVSEADGIPEAAPTAEKAELFVDKLTPEAFGWGLSFGEAGTQPVGNVSSEELKQYDAYFIGDGDERVIYLTFDCGYENGNTEPILDALKKHNAPATFFVVGHYLETEPDLVKRMVEEGHAVGSHTYHHPDVNTLPDLPAFQKEMDDVAELFTQITDEKLSMYYRPPEGKCGITNLEMAQELGYRTIFWSLAYVDWDTEHQPSHRDALEKLTARIHPGAVVLLHNTSKTNGEILDELLSEWEDMGYSFAPLSELTD